MAGSTWSRHRLRSSDDFSAVTRGGARSARSHVVVHLALLEQGDDAPRVGFVVSKKVGNSVIRHRVARRFREIVRHHLAEFPAGSTTVLRALPGIEQIPFTDLEDEVLGALGTATRKLEKRRAAASSAS
ncbi:ribonuclease P protein component [Brachybacterium horti]